MVLTIAFVLGVAASAAPDGQQMQLLERTLAIVAGQAITLSDVETALALRLVDAEDLDAATERLVERALVLREVERYAPPEPSDEAIAERLDAVRRRFDTQEQLVRVLDAGGFTQARLLAWIRDDLRIEAYLDQRFAAVVAPGEEEVAAVYRAERDAFDARGLSYEQAAGEIRERLSAERRAGLIEDWIGDLRRRTPVVELWRK